MTNSVEPSKTADAIQHHRAARATNPLMDTEGHVCAFFQSEDEEYLVLLPFIKDGIDHGERAVHLVGPDQREEHVRRLADAGIDVARTQANGQLVILDWSQTYLEGGHFDLARTMDQLARSRSEGHRLGYTRTRYIAHMEWALGGTDLHELAVYEATSNFAPLNGDVAICVYQIPRWDGQIMVNAFRTHSLVILGGVLHENAFFSPPDEVLAGLNAARARAE